MKYLEILREDEEVAAPASDIAPTATEPAAATKVYYHVTTKARLRSIQELGIEPNRNRRWRTGKGMQLGERGNIYLISDFTAAVRWGHKLQWEHFNGKIPAKSPYVIICVRENPKTLEPDPHPENGLYDHTWFQKAGSIEPKDIMKIIPLTADLVKQVTHGKDAVHEAIGSHYSARACHKALLIKGWQETQTPNMYKNPEYPEYSIDLDIHSFDGGGPFIVYRGSRRLGKMKIPPVAQHMAMKDKIIDTPAIQPEPESDIWGDPVR
jgi:hypothetical protein